MGVEVMVTVEGGTVGMMSNLYHNYSLYCEIIFIAESKILDNMWLTSSI